MSPTTEAHLVSNSNLLLEILKLLVPALIGAAVALIVMQRNARSNATAARRTWEWSARRDGYNGLLIKGYELASRASLVLVAVSRGATTEALDAEREKVSAAFAAFNASRVAARVTASHAGTIAIDELVRFVRVDLFPFIYEEMPSLSQWKRNIEPALQAKLDAIENAAADDLALKPD